MSDLPSQQKEKFEKWYASLFETDPPRWKYGNTQDMQVAWLAATQAERARVRALVEGMWKEAEETPAQLIKDQPHYEQEKHDYEMYSAGMASILRALDSESSGTGDKCCDDIHPFEEHHRHAHLDGCPNKLI